MIYEIITEEDYHEALIRFLEICKEAKPDSELKEINMLLNLMSKYESENCDIN